MSDIKWTELNPPERKRTYVYESGLQVEFTNVKRIEIRDSGKHRIEADSVAVLMPSGENYFASGGKGFVAPGWVALILDVDEWTC